MAAGYRPPTVGVAAAVSQGLRAHPGLGRVATGPVISFLPIFLVGILFGLAMDYEVFLVTRMREEHEYGAPPTDAVVNGFAHSARVVSAAAVIMFSVFAGFVLAPDPIVKSMGFALAVGVAVDAFLVRMTLVPAMMSLLGDAAWRLPSWLERLARRSTSRERTSRPSSSRPNESSPQPPSRPGVHN